MTGFFTVLLFSLEFRVAAAGDIGCAYPLFCLYLSLSSSLLVELSKPYDDVNVRHQTVILKYPTLPIYANII